MYAVFCQFITQPFNKMN